MRRVAGATIFSLNFYLRVTKVDPTISMFDTTIYRYNNYYLWTSNMRTGAFVNQLEGNMGCKAWGLWSERGRQEDE